MKIFKLINIFSLALMALFLASCGGSSSNVADIGTGGTGVAVGTVTGFGSVYVNGVKYKTEGASGKISDDDDSAITEDKIKISHVVEVNGSVESDGKNGSASSISVHTEVRGPVDVLFSAGKLGVMGQTVLVSPTTVIDNNIGATAGDLIINDMVKVHGFRDATGNILASRIEKDLGAPTEPFRVRGNITGLDTTTTTFKIGGLTINYSGAAVTPNTAALVEGARVAVRGTEKPVNGILKATKIKVKKTIEGKNGDRAEVEGLITIAPSSTAPDPTQFEVNGQKVTTSSTTVFEPSGKSAADLKVGVKVEAKGTLDANGVMVAKKIEFEDGEGVENEAHIKFSAAMQSATTTSITVLGKSFTVNSSTRFEDVTPAAMRPFNADNFSTKLVAGDHLTITAFADSTGALVAKRVERNNGTDVFVQGKLDAKAGTTVPTTLTIQGVTVNIDTATQFKRTSLAALTVGTTVKAKGTASGNSVTATEVELEVND
ncbi:MAG: DUF5666 domain-containing protein [Burkholderiales bacterium]